MRATRKVIEQGKVENTICAAQRGKAGASGRMVLMKKCAKCAFSGLTFHASEGMQAVTKEPFA
ncbi:MAG: hypothetical protein EON47_05405 [Acetobacteraceae bacterium]|nr:MAG: hypothetical protein EON47_05405 [Acetobacteraceae bacterium]